MIAADKLNLVNEYYFSTKLAEIEKLNAASNEPIINLGIGSPDLAPHISVIETLNEYAQKPNTHAYQSYKGTVALREAFAGFYKNKYSVTIDPNKHILPLIGSKEGIMHICQSFLNPGDFALIPNPGYPTYASAVLLSGGAVNYYDLNAESNWYPNIENLQNLVNSNKEKIKLLFISYPHMPTGQDASDEVFNQINLFAQANNILVINDNPYSFIRNKNPKSLLQTNGALNNCIELTSLSKSHNMAGWRVGAIIANEENIKTILKFKSNMDSGMFLPLQMAAAKALSLNNSWFDKINNIYISRAKEAVKIFDYLNISYEKKQTGLFLWGKIPSKYKDAYELSDEILYNNKVFLTPGGIFGSNGNNYIRISLCATEAIFEKALFRIKN